MIWWLERRVRCNNQLKLIKIGGLVVTYVKRKKSC